MRADFPQRWSPTTTTLTSLSSIITVSDSQLVSWLASHNAQEHRSLPLLLLLLFSSSSDSKLKWVMSMHALKKLLLRFLGQISLCIWWSWTLVWARLELALCSKCQDNTTTSLMFKEATLWLNEGHTAAINRYSSICGEGILLWIILKTV